jgi:hypothetical protein
MSIEASRRHAIIDHLLLLSRVEGWQRKSKMPKKLLQRCRPDSIAEFRFAAHQRFRDGLALAPEGRRTAAIYLWGYAAEMMLKAAYFKLIGFPPTQNITKADLRGAVSNAGRLGFAWIGNWHSLDSWAQLLVSTRASATAWAYPDPSFGNHVLARSRQVQRLWSEVLRYHKNVAYPHEVDTVKAATEWLFLHSSQL